MSYFPHSGKPFTLWSLDQWGNDKDGYDLNQWHVLDRSFYVHCHKDGSPIKARLSRSLGLTVKRLSTGDFDDKDAWYITISEGDGRYNVERYVLTSN